MSSNDNIFFIFLSGTLFITIFVSALILFLIQYKRKQVKFYTEKLEIQHKYATQLLQTKLEVQEQSFKYFSEEIHDNAGALLSSAKHLVNVVAIDAQDENTKMRLKESTELMSKAITDLRNISHTLNNSFIAKAGIRDAISKELQYIHSAKHLHAQLHVTGEEYVLGSEKELLIFRIIQEAIANALKHAAPTAINVYMDYGPKMTTVRICDNGKGFKQSENKSDGIGLDNMQVRADMLKGRLTIHSLKHAGTTIHLEIDNVNL